MSLTVFQVPPYHDDYLQNGVDKKNYQRILFRPGRAVQARELTQLQTALQTQIDRFGKSIYKDGTPVLDGLASIDNQCPWVAMQSLDVPVDMLSGVRIYSSLGPSAQIIGHKIVSGTTYLFLKYIGSGPSGDIPAFTAGSQLLLIQGNTPIGTVRATTPTGIGSRYSVDSGIYFIAGNFVHVDAASVYELERDLTGHVVLYRSEDTVLAIDDPDLYDNATGTSNHAAPGADRYRITLILQFVETLGTSHVQLLRVEEGRVHARARTEYTNLDRVLAERTHEESGNYIVRPFVLDVREHLNDGTNRGYKTADQGGDASLLAITVEPSVAYVDGYRIELADKKIIAIPKARDESPFSNTARSLNIGNYVRGVLEEGQAALDPTVIDRVHQLKNASDADIGTAKIRAIRREPDAIRIYLHDIVMSGSNVFSATRSIVHGSSLKIMLTDSLGVPLDGNTPASIYESTDSTLVFPLPYEAIRTLETSSSPFYDVRYTVQKKFTVSPDSETPTILTVPAGSLLLESTNPLDYFVFNSDNEEVAVTTVTGTSASRILTLAAAQTDQVTVIAPATKEDNAGKKADKTLQEATESMSLAGGTTVREDVHELLSVVHSVDDEDVTDSYEIVPNNTDEFYSTGTVRLRAGAIAPVGGTISVTYSYFNHGLGDYFSVDSYPIDYEKIPVWRGVRLSNSIDFRKKKSLTGTVDRLNPGATFVTWFSQYLPRIDKVIVNASGEFRILHGIPAENPSEPDTPPSSMALHTILIPAFTHDVAEVVVKYVDNRRYTMRDIGALDARLKNLEYYTALSLLEKETTLMNIGDRFKNGILVDSFSGHNVGDVSSPDYNCAMDQVFSRLRPRARESLVRLKSTLLTNLVRTGDLVTRDYDEVAHIVQPYASRAVNVNPYNVFSWTGILELSPSSDEWKDTERVPDLIVTDDSVYDSITESWNTSGVTGTFWNSWEVNWTGTTVTKGGKILPNGKNHGKTITTVTNSSRTGTAVSIAESTVTSNLGDKVVNLAFIPFIRSRKIWFRGRGLKPDTRVYAFFDGEAVSSYVTQTASGTFEANRYSETDDIEEFNGQDTDTITSSAILKTDGAGEIEGYLIIPNNSALRFRTGTRLFRLSDRSDNSMMLESTSGEVNYRAEGLLESLQTTIVSTRIPELVSSTMTESTSVTSVRYVDPLAQSFIIGNIPGGVFLTAFDLFFQSRDESVPVSIHLVTVENGIPTQKIVPFSRVILSGGDVAVSDVASEKTTFTFDSPVHLQDSVEYALVVMSNSDKYNVWTAELGGSDVQTGNKISQNPYAGVMFKSQNASTWTPDQTSDLKFTAHRAVFAGSGSITLNDITPASQIDYSLLNLIVKTLVFPGTSIAWNLQVTSESGITRSVNVNENIDLGGLRAIEITSGNPSLTLVGTLTGTEFLSPVIDLDRASAILIQNLVNNDSGGELSPAGGNALARYITRPVTLANSADRLNVHLAVNRPNDTDVKFYVRAGISEADIDLKGWIEVQPLTAIPVTSSADLYSDIEFVFGDDPAELMTFTTFQVKIVMLSNQSFTNSAVPTLKDLRIIASTT